MQRQLRGSEGEGSDMVRGTREGREQVEHGGGAWWVASGMPLPKWSKEQGRQGHGKVQRWCRDTVGDKR